MNKQGGEVLQVKTNDRSLLSNEVARNIRELIINQELKPQDKLPNEMELSTMMGVSRATIREAIKILASNNIVEISRGKGTFVTNRPGLVDDPLGVNFMDRTNLLESLFEARMLIEPGVASLAAERATKQDLAKIKESVERMSEDLEKRKAHKNEDLDFHIAIALASKNPIIQRIVPIINESIAHGYTETVNVPGSSQKAIAAHDKIYQAIKGKDPDQAKEAMLKHLQEALEDIKSKNREQ